MNILFLTPQLPYPANSGGTINSKKVLDYLCTRHSVALFALIKTDDNNSLESFKKIYKHKLKNFYYTNINKARSVFNYFISIIKNKPISIYRNSSRKAKRITSKIFAENQFDIIYCDHLIMSQYIPKQYSKKTVLYEHNAECMIWKRYAKIEKNLLKKTIIRLEYLRLRNYECSICNRFPVVMAAPKDIEILQSFHVEKAHFSTIYHLGVDDALQYSTVTNKYTYRLLFIGTMTWEANIDAIKWFVDTVYNKIKNKAPNVSLWIAGKYNVPPIYSTDETIHLLGFVDSLEELYNSATVFICPLQFGSGMKIKILDAMYRGLPIVTTTIGAESIELVDGENCFIADAPDDFANKTIQLLNEPNIWDKVSKNSRTSAEKKYRWETKFQQIETVLSQF